MVWRLFATILTGEAGTFIARLKSMATFYILMALFALGMLVSLLAALYVYLSSVYGELSTAIGFAVVFFVLTILSWIGVIIARRPPKTRADDRLKRDIASIAGVAALSNVPLMVEQVKRRKSLLLVPIAAAGGFAVWRTISGYVRGR